jgi:hypothetical protein
MCGGVALLVVPHVELFQVFGVMGQAWKPIGIEGLSLFSCRALCTSNWYVIAVCDKKQTFLLVPLFLHSSSVNPSWTFFMRSPRGS